MLEKSWTIKVLLFPDDHTQVWIAQGLEFDICVQAKTLEGAQHAFEQALEATALANIKEGKEPFEGIEKAPRWFWDKFEDAKHNPPLREKPSVPVRNRNSIRLVERLGAMA